MESPHGEDSNGTLFTAPTPLFANDDSASCVYKESSLQRRPSVDCFDDDLRDAADLAPIHATNVEIRVLMAFSSRGRWAGLFSIQASNKTSRRSNQIDP